MTTEAPETALVSRPKYWEIADEIQTWNETLLLVESQIAASLDHSEKLLLVEERGEIQQRLERIQNELLAGKTDALAGVLDRMESDIAAKTKEKDRLAKAIKAEVRALEGLQGYVVKGMETMGKDHLKGALSTITLRGKGGVAPLNVDSWDNDKERWTGNSILPDEFAKWEGRLTNHQMIAIRAALVEDGWESDDLDTLFAKFTRTPSNTLIRAALAEPCPDCHGKEPERCCNGVDCGCMGLPIEPPCETCGGTGKNAVPGCSLGDRGKSIVIR